MKYLCLVYREDAQLDHAAGEYPLEYVVDTPVTLRVRRDKFSIAAGHPDAVVGKLGAFRVVESRDLNEAILMASRIPCGDAAWIDVWPIVSQDLTTEDKMSEVTQTVYAERELVITRTLNAPRALVYKAWTESERVAQWWGPRGFTNPICEIDARPGGNLKIVMRGPDGVDYPMTGVFQEVVEPEKLVFSNVALDNDGNRRLEGVTTVTFTEQDGKTSLTMHTAMVGLVPKSVYMLEGMEAGWTQSLECLDEYLA